MSAPPSKPAFDPNKHLLSEGGTKKEKKDKKTKVKSNGKDRKKEETHDDAALARMLQEQILEEEREKLEDENRRKRSDERRRKDQQAAFEAQSREVQNHTQIEDDMQMVMRMQQREMEAASTSIEDMELARRIQQAEISDTVQNDYQNQLDYARRIQQQAFDDARRRASFDAPEGDRSSSQGSGSRPSDTGTAESDAEMARRMQRLEQMGMGMLNSTRQITVNNPLPRSQPRPQQQQQQQAQQEEEDARLARMIAESGASFRDIQFDAQPSISATQSPSTPSVEPLPPAPSSAARERPPQAQIVPTQPSVGDDPFGHNLGRQVLESPGQPKEKRKRGFFGRSKDKNKTIPSNSVPQAIPTAIPPPPGRGAQGPIPFATLASERVQSTPMEPNTQIQRKKGVVQPRNKPQTICSVCQRPASSFLIALDKKYHAECFKCVGCHLVIDSSGPFAYMADDKGDKHPLHRQCYAELYGVKCAVCKQSIPAGPDGKVSFVKHPFFDTEQMCPRHAANPGRRCTGCHRFEPEDEPFAELNDAGRVSCFACCRSVVVDSQDAQPLWNKVIAFFEGVLHLPIWKEMRKVPILVVGYDALNDQMMASGGAHGGSSQIMTRGLCLTEHQSGRRFKLSRVKFNKQNHSFEAVDAEDKGFTYFQVPDADKINPDASVTAILCLSGLPRDLSASVLAHEALHAWIKLHPRFDITYPIPPQVEEGCAQLIAMLFLTEGLEAASTETYGDQGPSDEKLRQYFKFSIETDDHEIYGEGYRRAAQAYANIGIEALLSHVVLYKDFPQT